MERDSLVRRQPELGKFFGVSSTLIASNHTPRTVDLRPDEVEAFSGEQHGGCAIGEADSDLVVAEMLQNSVLHAELAVRSALSLHESSFSRHTL